MRKRVTKRVTKRLPLCPVCHAQPLIRADTGRPRGTCSSACRQKRYRAMKAKRRAAAARLERDEWRTPRGLFEEWTTKLGPFDLDAAATPGNALCARFHTAADDGLEQDWGTWRVWCNPPYSKVRHWVTKGQQAAAAGATVVMLIPASTGTKWWHEYVEPAEYTLLKGRVRFGKPTGKTGGPAPFDSAVVIFRPLRRARPQ